MRQITVGLLLLGAMMGIIAPSGATEPLRPVQAQGQAPNQGQGQGRGQNQTQAQPVEPFRIIGNIYWVGGEYGSYLITTPAGHILHDTGTNEMHDTIVSNVKKLGFEVKDIKIMISSHAHFDHVQGHPQMQKLTGAQVVALGGDAAALEAGVDNSAGGFRGMQQVHVDRVIKDGDTVTLGGTTLRALWVPGHTQGATIWMMNVQENGRTYSVAFRGGETPNAGVPLFDNPRHPKVVEDTKFTLERLKALQPPDLFLHNHQQNLGRPLNPALPVNPRCITCLDAQAFKEMVVRSEEGFFQRLKEAEAERKK
jgi:metallo-beta-lactamase class B